MEYPHNYRAGPSDPKRKQTEIKNKHGSVRRSKKKCLTHFLKFISIFSKWSDVAGTPRYHSRVKQNKTGTCVKNSCYMV